MNHVEFWQFVIESIENAGKAALVKVVYSEGSSPGKQKFMLSLAPDGSMRGTIGGGVMEHRVIQETLQVLQADKTNPQVQLLIHRKDVPESSGLICSGLQKNVIVPLTRKDLPVLHSIVLALQQQSDGVLIIDSAGLQYTVQRIENKATSFQQEGDSWSYRERYGKPEVVYVVGSGHVGLAICKLLSFLGMHVICFDRRAEAPTVQLNTHASRMIICEYHEIGNYIEDNENAYIVIVTSAGDTDNAALQQVVRKENKFIGLMGSAAKKAKIFKDLKAAGFSEEHLKKIVTPIGLPMNSFTPDEIAVSIAGQIIHIRNGG